MAFMVMRREIAQTVKEFLILSMVVSIMKRPEGR
jgi:hypothetical protein